MRPPLISAALAAPCSARAASSSRSDDALAKASVAMARPSREAARVRRDPMRSVSAPMNGAHSSWHASLVEKRHLQRPGMRCTCDVHALYTRCMRCACAHACVNAVHKMLCKACCARLCKALQLGESHESANWDVAPLGSRNGSIGTSMSSSNTSLQSANATASTVSCFWRGRLSSCRSVERAATSCGFRSAGLLTCGVLS